jgi:hypothetical protein
MDTAEVVPSEIQSQRSFQVFKLLAERIRQSIDDIRNSVKKKEKA